MSSSPQVRFLEMVWTHIHTPQSVLDFVELLTICFLRFGVKADSCCLSWCRRGVRPRHHRKSGEAAVHRPEVFVCRGSPSGLHLLHDKEPGDVRRL